MLILLLTQTANASFTKLVRVPHGLAYRALQDESTEGLHTQSLGQSHPTLLAKAF